MFIAAGLVVGSLVGLVTSLLRRHCFSLLLTLSTIFGAGIILIDLLIVVVYLLRSSGDDFMAAATLAFLSVVGIIVLLVVGFGIGGLLSLFNGERFHRNTRTIFADAFLLVISMTILNTVILEPIRNRDSAERATHHKTLEDRRQKILDALPAPYNKMTPEDVAAMNQKADEREQRGYERVERPPAEVQQEMREVALIREGYMDLPSHYMQDVQARNTLAGSLIAGWLVSVLASPILLKRRQQAR